jgi:endonuclease/exonuclease/phosphatase family metal-dependent hydrolase
MPPSIRILTYNTAMVPGPGGEARARRIANAILGAQPAFDVLCLQEVFDEDIREILAKKLRPTFPHVVAKSDAGDLLNEDSGLFFATRFPILGHKFQEFAEAEPATTDALSDKGVFGARLDVSARVPKKELLVFSTHLQSSAAYWEVREKQLAQIRRVIQKSHDLRKAATILVGDFNVVGERKDGAKLRPTTEYGRMLARLNYPRDLFREMNPADPGFTWDPTKNREMIPKDDDDHERLDYLLAFDHVPVADDASPRVPIPRLYCSEACLAMGPEVGKKLSDHFAMTATVSFSSKA